MLSRTTLPPDLASVPVARHWAADLALVAGCSGTAVGTLALVVSELVANAVTHASSEFTLELDVTTGPDGRVALHVAVSDEDSRLPRFEPLADDALGGRGMHLVRELSEEFGVEKTPAGKTVWCRVADEAAAVDYAVPTQVAVRA